MLHGCRAPPASTSHGPSLCLCPTRQPPAIQLWSTRDVSGGSRGTRGSMSRGRVPFTGEWSQGVSGHSPGERRSGPSFPNGERSPGGKGMGLRSRDQAPRGEAGAAPPTLGETQDTPGHHLFSPVLCQPFLAIPGLASDSTPNIGHAVCFACVSLTRKSRPSCVT